MKRIQRKNTGFTLIELLVVITIIAVLAAILFPVFASVRAKARQVACASNLKQVGLALMQYAQDYDEVEPLGTVNKGWRGARCSPQSGGCTTGPTIAYDWLDEIYPYIKTEAVYDCPDDRETNANNAGYNYIFRAKSNAYAFGDYLANAAFEQNLNYSYQVPRGTYGPLNDQGVAVPLAKLQNSSQTIFCADGANLTTAAPGFAAAEDFEPFVYGNAGGTCNENVVSTPCAIVSTYKGIQLVWDNSTNSTPASLPNLTALVGRHPGNTINCLFCDGHVKGMTPTQILGPRGQYGYPTYLTIGGG